LFGHAVTSRMLSIMPKRRFGAEFGGVAQAPAEFRWRSQLQTSEPGQYTCWA